MMRQKRILYLAVCAAVACGLMLTISLTAVAQYKTTTPKPKTGISGGGAASATDEKEAEEPIDYLMVSAAEIQTAPERFEGKYVQLADAHGGGVTRFPAGLTRYGITPGTYYGFFTHHVVGSGMVCFVSRDNEEAKSFIDTLGSESPIYLMGRVGSRINTTQGPATFFLVDRMVRGNKAPPPPVTEQKKEITFVMEWEVETPEGKKRANRDYKIPEAGKTYIIPDPYTGKPLYMTFQF